MIVLFATTNVFRQSSFCRLMFSSNPPTNVMQILSIQKLKLVYFKMLLLFIEFFYVSFIVESSSFVAPFPWLLTFFDIILQRWVYWWKKLMQIMSRVQENNYIIIIVVEIQSICAFNIRVNATHKRVKHKSSGIMGKMLISPHYIRKVFNCFINRTCLSTKRLCQCQVISSSFRKQLLHLMWKIITIKTITYIL